MKVLILGGTGWLGAHTARSALEAGHQVTRLARGETVPDGAHLIRADRDDEAALRGVAAEEWDAVIDLATEPAHVRRAVRDLHHARHYVFVSTVSVYASHAEHGVAEHAALLEPLSHDRSRGNADYGAAKVACERLVSRAFGARAVVVRPGLIAGPGDPTQRSTYWPQRFARASRELAPVLVPDALDQPTSVIDVRDLAGWLIHLAASATTGTLNAVGHSVTLADHLRTAQAAAEHEGDLVQATPQWLLEQEVAEWAGPRSMPLWIADSQMHGMNSRSNARALRAGLKLRPLAHTLQDCLNGPSEDIGSISGLTDEDERQLRSLYGVLRITQC